MIAKVFIAGFILLLIIGFVYRRINGWKYGTSDDAEEKHHRFLRWIYGGKHPQQKFNKNLVAKTVRDEENLERLAKEMSKNDPK